MRHAPALTLAALLSAVPAGTAFAQAQLHWDDCSEAGAKVRTFACNTNAGIHVLVGSARLAAPLGDMAGYAAELTIHAATAVPPWWQMFNGGSCRATSLSADLNPPEGLTCREWYSFGYASGGITSYLVGSGGVQRVRVRIDASSDPAWAAPLAAGDEILLFRLLINNARTVGTCGGCEVPVAVFFESLRLLSPAAGGVTVPAQYPEAFASWQCALSGGSPEVLFDCPTPARPGTWSRIKAVYR